MKKVNELGQVLEGFDSPAILVTEDYEILASNKQYQAKFGGIDYSSQPTCFSVSHGYSAPCDQAGEDCPLHKARKSGKKEKVLHIHQTSNGREHVNVEMIPIFDEDKQLNYFIELLTPVPLTNGSSASKKIVGNSLQFKRLLSKVERVAKTDVEVLLLGESGTGKELISSLIHLSSPRSKEPFVTLECSGLSETLIESELFGHKKGSFTGANTDKKGIVEYADKGTLFLDEIGDVSLATQVKLLRLIESKTFRRVGESEVRTTNFRLVCATHRNLKEMVNAGTFRLDLYHRINVFPILVPSLAERIEDLPELAKQMIKITGHRHAITPEAMDLLCAQQFPGNIRELKNIITRAIVLSDTEVIDVPIIQEALTLGNYEFSEASLTHSQQPTRDKGKAITLQQLEAEYWQSLMKKHNNNKENIAKEAGVSLRTLYRKLEKIEPS